MPAVGADVAMWGDDSELGQVSHLRIASRSTPTNPARRDARAPGESNVRQVILDSHAPNGDGGPAAWRDFATRIAEGHRIGIGLVVGEFLVTIAEVC